MQHPILATKLFIPIVKAEQVSRARLLERLNSGYRNGCRLSLVSAPAGYGKTTLVAEWLRSIAAPGLTTAWLSLDEQDNDSTRFQRYVIAALQKAEPLIGQTALVLLDLPGTGQQDALTLLINDLSDHPQRFILVLDDYHLIHSLEIQTWVNSLLDNLPPNLHLVISTRSDPLLRLARLRARAQMVEIRSEDIRFTSIESNQFLTQSMGLSLTEGEFTRLDEQIEGWAAGLQLAALAAAAQPGGSELTLTGERFLMDYLFEEVFIHQAPDVQEFLLKTSVLDRMCCSLCDALLEEQAEDDCSGSISVRQFEYLERANLFIVPLDGRHEWYRYHHLFAGLLHKRLTRTYGEPVLNQLRMAASRWCETNQYISEAVDYALAAQDDRRAADLIEKYGMGMLQRTAVPLPTSWLAVLDRMDLSGRPMLCVVAAFVELFKNPEPPGPLENKLDAIAQALEKQPADYLDSPTVTGYMEALKSAVGRIRGAQPVDIIRQASHALQLLPEDARLARFNATRALYSAYMIQGEPEAAKPVIVEAVRIALLGGDEYHYMSSIFSQAHVTAYQGWLKEAARICRDGLAVVHLEETGGRSYLGAGSLQLWYGSLLLEWNDLEGAEQYLRTGVEGLRYLAEPYMLMRGWTWLGKVHWLKGEIAQAELYFERGRTAWPGADRFVANYLLRLKLRDGDVGSLEAGSHWALAVELDQELRAVHRSMLLEGEWHFIDQMTLIRVMLARARSRLKVDFKRLIRSLDLQEEVASDCGWGSRRVEVGALKALALAVSGNTSAALVTLRVVLGLAVDQDYMRIFIDEGPPMQALLQALRSLVESKSLAAYVDRMLAVLEGPKLAPTGQALITLANGIIIEPLTEREIEVLRLIAMGLSNAEIAARLVLSTNTLKAHTQNIYHKLDAHSRLQAVNRAKEAGILNG
jgi:LuxR family transcriptional regulator, maltose regulon positive regulatory protein